MEEWKSLLEEKLLTQIEEKQKLNQEIINDLNKLTDIETNSFMDYLKDFK